jgi:hypothetical protein
LLSPSIEIPENNEAVTPMAIKTKFVTKDRWQTLEYLWNLRGTVFFVYPQGARIRVRYGSGKRWRGFTSQEKKLTGRQWIKLNVGGIGTPARARLQISVKEDTHVSYQIYLGGAPVSTPELQ